MLNIYSSIDAMNNLLVDRFELVFKCRNRFEFISSKLILFLQWKWLSRTQSIKYKHWKWKFVSFFFIRIECGLIKHDCIVFFYYCLKFYGNILVSIQINSKWTSFTERCIFNFLYFSNPLKRKCVKYEYGSGMNTIILFHAHRLQFLRLNEKEKKKRARKKHTYKCLGTL